MIKAMYVVFTLLMLLTIFDFWWAGYPGLPIVGAYGQSKTPWVDCKKFAPKTLVKDYDGRLWLVDICAVAQDDAGASQYKTEVKTK